MSFIAGDLGGFTLENLPLGVGKLGDESNPLLWALAGSIYTRVGDFAVDLKALSKAGLLSGDILSRTGCLELGSLNALMGLGQPAWTELRTTLQRLLSSSEGALRDNTELRSSAIHPVGEVVMEVPAIIGDYTDFYASRHHATNVGTMFRGSDNALNPNWLHLPVGYHGRSSSIVLSGTDVHRPKGQVLLPGSSHPVFQPSAAVDFELELACLIGPGSELGSPISVTKAKRHIFGVVLMNDWSARDIQKWEYVPLGPFTAKNWATSISPWVVTMDALEPFTTDAEFQEPTHLLPHLQDPEHRGLDIHLTVDLVPAGSTTATTVTRTNFKYMYWSFPQMIAHHSSSGCNLRPGDMLGSGTISGPKESERGCLLELTWGGQNPVKLQTMDGSPVVRKYLEDGDEVVIRGSCTNSNGTISLGECRGRLLTAKGCELRPATE